MIKELPIRYYAAHRYLKVGETYKCEISDDSNILVHGTRSDGWLFTCVIPKKHFYKSFIKPMSVW